MYLNWKARTESPSRVELRNVSHLRVESAETQPCSAAAFVPGYRISFVVDGWPHQMCDFDFFLHVLDSCVIQHWWPQRLPFVVKVTWPLCRSECSSVVRHLYRIWGGKQKNHTHGSCNRSWSGGHMPYVLLLCIVWSKAREMFPPGY